MAGIAQNTVFVQITCRCAECGVFGTTGDGSVCLIGHRGLEHHVLPVGTFAYERRCTCFGSVTISGKSMREHLEAINHAQAVEFIKDIARQDIEINERTIKEIHAIVLHGINKENAGRYRTVPVMISGSRHMPPQPYLIEKQMEDFMLRFTGMEAEHVHPILVSAYLHDELVRIHPFIDGNGRTSRLLMNLYLLRNGYTIVNLKGSDEAKASYYKALEASHVENNPTPFQTLVIEAETASLERYLSIVDGGRPM